jgi:hypothetical protein
MRLSIVALFAVLATPGLAGAQNRTCTINRLVIACSGIDMGTNPAQAAAMLKPYETQIVDVLVPDGPRAVRRPSDVDWRDVHQDRLRFADHSNIECIQPRKKFGESPWWWSELYDPWWAEPWVAKPWNLQPLPEPFPERCNVYPRP